MIKKCIYSYIIFPILGNALSPHRLLLQQKLDLLFLIWVLKSPLSDEIRDFLEEIFFSTTINFSLNMESLRSYEKIVKHEKFKGSLIYDENDPILKNQLLHVYESST